MPNVDVESEDEFEDDTDEDENDDSSPPMMGSESRRRWSAIEDVAPDAEAVGSLLMLRPTSLFGLVIGLDGLDPLSLAAAAAAATNDDDACWELGDRVNLKISHLLLLLPLTALLVLGLLLDLQLVLLLLLLELKLNFALADMRRSLLAAVETAASTAEADFLIGDLAELGFTGAEVTDVRLPLGEQHVP